MSGDLVHFQSRTVARQNETRMCRDTVHVGKKPSPLSQLINPLFYRLFKENKFLGVFDLYSLCFNLMFYFIEDVNCWLLSSLLIFWLNNFVFICKNVWRELDIQMQLVVRLAFKNQKILV